MGVLAVIFLGCVALLSASCSAESSQKQAEVVELLENSLRILEDAFDKEQQLEQQQDISEVSRYIVAGVKTGTKSWRTDYRCGAGYNAPNGKPAECSAIGWFPCCSPEGFCGKSRNHCECPDCLDYRKVSWRNDGRCGRNYKAPNGQQAECNPGGNGPCCSKSGWCGNSRKHCRCYGCTDYSKN
ncbi:lectin-B-like [Branchiostoma floridae]|uniref:Lectin-B-like n=1 Tax=Branchiostoma floridae TaxID=7739 RepID=A0A9J7LF81_BRAFL|nr:lectin-B-like [Branchiostoma floridae]